MQDLHLADKPLVKTQCLSSLDSAEEITPQNFISLLLHCNQSQQQRKAEQQPPAVLPVEDAEDLPGPGKRRGRKKGPAKASAKSSARTTAKAKGKAGQKRTKAQKATAGAQRDRQLRVIMTALSGMKVRVHTSLCPVLPDDSGLRLSVASSIFDATMLSLERSRFRYVRSLLPTALSLAGLDLSAPLPRPEADPLSVDSPAVQRLAQHVQGLAMVTEESVDLGMSSYLPASVLLCPRQDILDFCKTPGVPPTPEFLSKRQWYDLFNRGVKPFRNIGCIRAALLYAIVNAELGLNILEKPLGACLTEHAIRFGMQSTKGLCLRDVMLSSAGTDLAPSCLYEAPDLIAYRALCASRIVQQRLLDIAKIEERVSAPEMADPAFSEPSDGKAVRQKEYGSALDNLLQARARPPGSEVAPASHAKGQATSQKGRAASSAVRQLAYAEPPPPDGTPSTPLTIDSLSSLFHGRPPALPSFPQMAAAQTAASYTEESEALADDSEISDWDILETPASVVWALRWVGDAMESETV